MYLQNTWNVTMEKYHLCYIFILLVTFCDGTKQIYKQNDNTELHKCVTMILGRIELGNVTDVTVINVDVELVKALHSLLPRPVRVVSRTFYWPNGAVFNDVYVIQFEDIFIFEQGMDSVRRDPFWNPRAKFIIIIDNLEYYLQEVSGFLIHNHIYNVALVAYSDDRNVSIYSFGHQRDECDRPTIKGLELLTPCLKIHNIDIDRILTSDRKPELRGCRVQFVSHNYWPFVSFEGKSAIENYLLALFSQYEGITVELVNFGIIETPGERLSNFTYTGMLHEIETYHVEGAIGGYSLTFDRMSNLDFIDPYMVNRYKIVILRAELLSMWSAVLKQFGVQAAWTIFAIFCVLCVIVTFMGIYKKQVRDTSRDILIVWGYFLNNISQEKVKSRVAYRMLLLNILLYVFINSCAIQASLLSFTTHPIRGYQPNTVEEVISNCQFIISPTMDTHLQTNPVIDLSNVNTTCCNTTLDCLMKVMTNVDQSLFTITSDIYHESNIWKFADAYGDLKIHTLREPLGMLLKTMYLRRGSPLTAPFNKLLLRIRSAGLIDRFVSRLHYTERVKYKFNARGHRKPQTLHGLRGVFMVFIYGCCISVITFVIEYLLSIIFVVFYI
ncbi:uncharacterized protein LOC134800720 [Cydia splendana]|uniref:uncharacterized protein LOC134800720 n=1 Tax=Cydia splendana TaxID=1100963 RepID=UPI00300C9CA2